MSELIYNSIRFGPDCWDTLAFEKEAVYDSTNTDVMYNRITITGEGILAGKIPPISDAADDPLGVVSGLTANSSPASAFTELFITSQFMQPRRQLSFTVNGQQLIPGSDQNFFVDDNNGPLPQYCRLQRINEAAFAFQLKIIGHWAENGSLANAGYILSHRWTETSEIDRDFFTTKTRQGKVVVSSAKFNSVKGGGATSTDGLRETLVTCSIMPGFVRLKSQYVLNSNGLELGYTLVDQEQFRLPPQPATTADGDFGITTQAMGTIGRTAYCRVALKGPKKSEANPLILVKLATGIALNRLRQAGAFFATQANFHEKLYSNEVDVTITGRLNQQKKPKGEKQVFDLLAGINQMGITPLGSDIGTPPPDPGTRGTANVLLHAAAWQDPTLAQTLNKADNSLNVQGGDQTVQKGVPGG